MGEKIFLHKWHCVGRVIWFLGKKKELQIASEDARNILMDKRVVLFINDQRVLG